MASSKIVDLRKLLAERFACEQPPAPSFLATGVATLDRSVGGGLPKSGITEVTSDNASAGTATLISALLHQAYRDGYFVALIDGRDSFDPQPLEPALLQHLLWVRCTNMSEAMRAADFLLRDGNFPLVVLDLILNAPSELRGVRQTTWYRLQRLVERIPTAFLVLSRHSIVASAQLKLVLDNRWSLRDMERENHLEQLVISVRRSHITAGDFRQQLAS